MSLSWRRQKFIIEYLADPTRNGKAAAIKAGFSNHGDSAKVHASQMLRDPEVQQEISRQMKKAVEKLDVSVEQVVRGILESIENAKAAGTGAWQSQATQRGYEMLGRYLGMFHEKVDITADNAIIEQLMQGRKYAARITGQEDEEEETQDDSSTEPKPN